MNLFQLRAFLKISKLRDVDMSTVSGATPVLSYNETTGKFEGSAGVGGSVSTALEITVSQTGHGLSVNNAIRRDAGGSYELTDNDTAANARFVGFVSEVVDANNFKYKRPGSFMDTFSGLTDGAPYYLSGTPGAITATEPVAPNIRRHVLTAIGATGGVIESQPGVQLSDDVALLASNNLSEVDDAAAAFANIKQAATTEATGVSERATVAEAEAGLDDERHVTPAGVAAAIAALGGGGDGGTPANPTAEVGLGAVNGSASTFMRSDAAPPLSQDIEPTWTEPHLFQASAADDVPVTIKAHAAQTADLHRVVNDNDNVILRLTLDGKVFLIGHGGFGGNFTAISHDDDVLHSAYFTTTRYGGSSETPTAVLSGYRLGVYRFVAYDGTELIEVGSVVGVATEDHDGSNRGARLDFLITPNGATDTVLMAALTELGLRSEAYLTGKEITGTPVTPESDYGAFYTGSDHAPKHIAEDGTVTVLSGNIKAHNSAGSPMVMARFGPSGVEADPPEADGVVIRYTNDYSGDNDNAYVVQAVDGNNTPGDGAVVHEIIDETGEKNNRYWLTALMARFTKKLRVGPGTNSTFPVIEADTAATDKPALRWNHSTTKWQYSNNGTAWEDFGSGGGGGGAALARDTATITTASIAHLALESDVATVAKSCQALKIETDRAAWVRFYPTEALRDADASRDILDEPPEGSCVLLEVATTGAQEVWLRPTLLYCGDDTETTDIYYSIQNRSGSTAAVEVVLAKIDLEA